MDPFALRSTPPLGVLQDDGSLDPAFKASLSEELAIALYEHMVLARALDETVAAFGREDVVARHSRATGAEATIVGSVAAMKDEDWVFPSSHEVVAALWRGMPLSAYAHQWVGNALALGKGRNTPDPPFWRQARVASGSLLVGTQIPHAVGLAWAAHTRANDVAALVFFDKGDMSSGDFHTGLNFAGVERAPVVAVCRNDGSAAGAPMCAAPNGGLAITALAYGLTGVRVDGGDVVAVLSVVRAARERAAAGLGGTLVEAIATIRRGPVQAGGLSQDPIARMRRYLETQRLWSADRDQHLLAEVQADVESAFAAAAAAHRPALETVFEHVYAELPWHLKEQRDE